MFTADASNLLQLFLSKSFQILQVTVPGTNVSFFGLFAGILITAFVIKLISLFIGIPMGLSAPSLHDSLKSKEGKK